jgi:23S rRNA pseudouridine1911/1915/1917 synthase
MTELRLTADRILYEDHHLLVVDKPAPLLTQAPAHIPSLEAMVKAYIKEKYAKPGGVYLAVPHRLDRPVTGVICFVRNTKAAQRVQEQFEARTVRKTYWAALAGEVQPDSGEWTDWLKKIPDRARVVKTDSTEPGAKMATLQYRILDRSCSRTLVEFIPSTGRMHQLRVQSAIRGHPILGDALYADSQADSRPTHEYEQPIALHARSLSLVHPFQKTTMEFVAKLPDHECWEGFSNFRRNDENFG